MIDMLVLGQTAAEGLPPLPMDGGFFSLPKILVMVVCLFLWALPAGWCSRDAKGLSLNQYLWGSMVLFGGMLGWLFWFFVPMYAVGLMFYFLFGFGTILVYALYRDTLVEDRDKIMNPTNFLAALKGHTEEKFEVVEKVRLATTTGREPKIPEGTDGQKMYQSFQNLMFDGLWRRANEILVQPAGDNALVRFKIDGVVADYDQWDRTHSQGVIDYVKGICDLDLNEHRQPQKGKLVAQLVSVNRKVTLDLETAGSTAGEKMIVRVRAEEARFTMSDVGMTKEQLEKFQGLMDAKSGLVLLSGMPDTGVTSTMYAVARSLDAFTQNIHSVEIKRLMDLDNITQNIHQAGSDKSFAKFIQSISRREPDTMLIDPCPDPETAQMLGQIVASKNKKMFTTVRASSSFSALGRMVRWIEDPQVAADVILGVTFQRLVRKLCPACREAYTPNQDLLRKFNLTASKVNFYRPPTQQVVDKKGNPVECPTCQGSGYLGRTGVFEMLIVDDALRDAIRSNDASRIKAAAKKCILKLWQDAALDKVMAGETSLQEVARVSKEAESLTGKKQ